MANIGNRTSPYCRPAVRLWGMSAEDGFFQTCSRSEHQFGGRH